MICWQVILKAGGSLWSTRKAPKIASQAGDRQDRGDPVAGGHFRGFDDQKVCHPIVAGDRRIEVGILRLEGAETSAELNAGEACYDGLPLYGPAALRLSRAERGSLNAQIKSRPGQQRLRGSRDFGSEEQARERGLIFGA